MAKNILDTFGVVDIFVENVGNPGTTSIIDKVKIIQFDLVGLMTEIPVMTPTESEDNPGEFVNVETTEVVFFPWNSVKMIRPYLPTEVGPIDETLS